MDPLAFLARVVVHIPDKGHVTTRYYGWYANRPRGMRRQAEPATADAPPAIVPAPRLAPTVASRRWAALLQQVIDQILAHLRPRATREAHVGPRSPPSTRAPARSGDSRAPAPSDAPTVR